MFIVKHYQPKSLFIVKTNPIQTNSSFIPIKPSDSTQQTTNQLQSSILIQEITPLHKPLPSIIVPHFNKKIKFRLTNIKDTNSKNKDTSPKNKKHPHDSMYAGGRWKEDEHHRFIDGMIKYSNNWKLLQKSIQTRSISQVRSHAQKFIIRIKKAKILDFDLEFTKASIQRLNDYLNELTKQQSDRIIQLFKAITRERNPTQKSYYDTNYDNNEDDYDFGNQGDDVKYILNGFIQTIANEDLYDFDQQLTRNPFTSHNNHPRSIKGRSSFNIMDGLFENYIEDKEIKDLNVDKSNTMTQQRQMSIDVDGNHFMSDQQSRKVSNDEDYLLNYLISNPIKKI